MNTKAMKGVLLATVLAGAMLPACDDAPLPDGPIIIVSNDWVNEADAEHVFNFQSPDDGAPEGSFDGQETRPDDDTANPLTGSWERGHITFTVTREGGARTYAARFDQDEPLRLAFAAGSEQLVLLRNVVE